MTSIAIAHGIGYSFAPARGQGVSGEAERLDELLLALRDERHYSVLLGWRSELAGELREIFEECSVLGWDGYEARPISLNAMLQSTKFLDVLPEGLIIPEIVPEPDGSIGLDWDNSLDMSIILSFGIDRIAFSAILGDHRRTSGVRPLSDEIPNEILDLLRRYFAVE